MAAGAAQRPCRTGRRRPFTVVFGEDGRLSGLGACNRLMGSYETTETGGLTVGQMASTPDVLSRFGPGAGFQRRFVGSDPLRSGRRYADASYRRRTAGCFAGQIAGLCGFCDGGTFRGSSVCIYGNCISFCSQPCRPDRFVSDFSVL